jgi:hypothetical protein
MMKRAFMPRTTGTWTTTATLGESVRAFVPRPLSPADPPLAEATFFDLNRTAELALARLAGVSGLVPSVDAERSIIDVASFIATDRRRLLASHGAGPISYRLFECLPMMPRFSVERVRQRLETTFPTAPLKAFEGFGHRLQSPRVPGK